MKKSRLVAMILVFALTVCLAGCDSSDYKKATGLYEEGKYEEAIAIFEELGDYENSADMVNVCRYDLAKSLYDAGDFDGAKPVFEALGNYNDSADMVSDCTYQKAEALYAAGSYEEALALYEGIADYKDTTDKITAAKKEIMFAKYGDVIAALAENYWFFNGGSDAAVNVLGFTEDTASITQVYYDGNGKHTNEPAVFSYIVDDANVIMTLADGSEMTIAYSMDGGSVKLEDGYFTLDAVIDGLQGYWNSRESDVILGMQTSNDYNVYISGNEIQYEYASKAFGGRNGEYYYYGPHAGTFEVTEYGMDADVRNGMMFGFNIIDGQVVLLRYDNICKPGDGFPGANGYSF